MVEATFEETKQVQEQKPAEDIMTPFEIQATSEKGIDY